MAFYPDWRDRDKTGMVGTVSVIMVMNTPESGMKTPENGMVGDSRRGTGSGGDCFKMFKTVGVNLTLGWKPNSSIVTQTVLAWHGRNSNGIGVAWTELKRYWRGMDGTQTVLGWHGRNSNGIGVAWTELKRYWRGMDGTQTANFQHNAI